MKNSLLKGTLILTFAGFLTRVLGFFYRKYLSNGLGLHMLGIYQMVFPVYAICFTLYASGIQTGISQILSSTNSHKLPNKLLKNSLFLSLLLAIILSIIIYFKSDFIANALLGVPECGKLLRILSIVFPFCGVTSVINGIFYGLSQSKTPAITQMIEQIIRICFVIFISSYPFFQIPLTCELAVWGLIIGEISSNIYNLIQLKKVPKSKDTSGSYIGRICKLMLPLSATRVIIALLNSFEAVMIPIMLVKYGFTNSEALTIFGIISGIVLPFILFPGAITNSLSVLLLPAISSANGRNNLMEIRYKTQESIKYTILLGILFTVIFSLFGDELGIVIFHSQDAGKYLAAMSGVCPFIYASTTLSSIINGLGKTSITFKNTVIGLLIRILALLFLTPHIGIIGYLVGYLFSQFIITILDGRFLYHACQYQLSIITWFIRPALFLYILGFICKKAIHYIPHVSVKYDELLAISLIPAICIIYYLYLRKYRIIPRELKLK